MAHPYEDILQQERPLSDRHRPMPRAQRAAQFAPFAALHGHEEAVDETAQRVEKAHEGR